MPNTQLLAKGSPVNIGPAETVLAQLDVSAYRTIRLSVYNWGSSPSPVTIAALQVDQPNTSNSNVITVLDSFTVAPGESVSNAYEVPGEVILFQASPVQPLGGIQIAFTLYGRTD